MNIKDALLVAHGSNVFTTEFHKEFTFVKKSFKQDTEAEEAADFIKAYKAQGYTTKKQTFNSLNRIFCTAIKNI